MNELQKAAGALLSFAVGYLYVICVLEGLTSWGMLLFTAVFVLFTEYYAYCLGCTHTSVSMFWLVFLVSCAALSIRQPEGFSQLYVLLILAVHASAVYYVLARFDLLSEHKTSEMILFDALSGFVIIPWSHFFLRVRSLAALPFRRIDLSFVPKILLTLLVICPAVMFAWGQLADASAAFAAIDLSFLTRFDVFLFSSETWLRVLFSIPVGAWLHGLVAGAAETAFPLFDSGNIRRQLDRVRILPALSEDVLIMVLCMIYTLFFCIQAKEYFSADIHMAAQASVFAINGFWSLCRIMILNIAVLAAGRCFAPKEYLDHRIHRTASAALMGFGIAFCMLNAAKLLKYMSYGLTERRLIAFWFLAVLLAACLAALVHVFRPLEAVRLVTICAAAGFLVLAAVCTALQEDTSYDAMLAQKFTDIT